MKTKELISRFTRYEGLYVQDMGDRLEFKEAGSENAFYTVPKWATHLSNGSTNLRNISKSRMLPLFNGMVDIVTYLNTPPEEREDPKLYNVKFPGITRDGKPIYLARHTGENDRIGVDWSSKDYIERIKSQFAFTEQEIKAINGSYWEFAEEVTE